MDQQNTGSNTGVQFEESGIRGWGAVRYYRQAEPPKFAQFLIKHSGGLFTDAAGAAKGLVWIAILCFVGSIVLVGNSLGWFTKKVKEPQVYQEDLTPALKATLSPEILQKIPYRNKQ